MFSCKFMVSNSIMRELNDFIDLLEVSNVSIFENPSLGFAKDLDDCGFPIANFFNAEIFVDTQELSKHLENRLVSRFGERIINFRTEILSNQDWIELYTKDLTPVLCDKFYFYNEEIQKATDNKDFIPIKLNSALAFGSGHHQTTKGCLLNLIFLDDMGFSPKNMLDMGCGTGILGICALKLWPESKLLGIDIDNDAVEITNSNYAANDVSAAAVQGFNVDYFVSAGEKFGLIFCNILKQPLIDLCCNFAQIIADNGYIITSGYIKSQEDEVVDCYLSNGFEIVNRICSEDWLSILFRKKR